MSTEAINRRTVYVGGINEQVSKDILQAAFIPFGPIRSVDIPLHHIGKTVLGFGFVQYTSEEDAKSAIDNMNGNINNEYLVELLNDRCGVMRSSTFRFRVERIHGCQRNQFTRYRFHAICRISFTIFLFIVWADNITSS